MIEYIVYGLAIAVIVGQIYIFAKAIFDKDVNNRRGPRL
jgi:capsular polysaccharide biosynthesis protein